MECLKDSEPPKIQKSDEERRACSRALKSHYLFKTMPKITLEKLIDALDREHVESSSRVIVQNDKVWKSNLTTMDTYKQMGLLSSNLSSRSSRQTTQFTYSKLVLNRMRKSFILSALEPMGHLLGERRWPREGREAIRTSRDQEVTYRFLGRL